jgi:hypothetical protein
MSLSSEGVNEVAWDKEDALRVVSMAANAGLPILGSDVWRVDPDGRWRASGDNWFSERRPFEAASAYVERSRAEAIAYLNRYPERRGSSTRYVVVSGKPSA